MSIQLLIPGQPEAPDRASVRGGPPGGDQAEAVTELLDNVDVLASFNLSPSARARTAQPSAFEAEDDDILEIEVEGGFKIWTSARRYSEEVPLLKPEARSGDGRIVVDTLPRTSERGVTDWTQTGLRILRLRKDGDPIAAALADPAQWPDDLKALAGELGLKAAIGLPAWFATKLVLRLIENRLNPGPGLYKWADATRKLKSGEPSPAPVSFDGFDVEQPMLVFIHGTMSCTLGSFGAFKGEDAQPHWQALERLFGDRIYAFEHRSMSDSPIDNAIDLLAALPRNARVNIVSHSRGGLIGDLVSLTGIGAHLITRFDRRDPELRQVDKRDAEQLQKLARLIAEKQLRVERFVRCASPSRGTLFVSENLDNFLSVLTNLVGLIPGIGGTPLYEVAKRLTLEIVKNRTKPGLVPGVEAVMPASPICALLNDVAGRAAGAVGVLSGDVEGGSWFKRLGVFVTDELLYEGRDNDLVVNTDAMFHGARRELACYVFDQGADVSHFNYFKNHRTRTALVDWLAAKPGAKPEPFKDIAEDELEPVPMLRSMQTRAGADQPIVFVLPGIMGSHLNVGDREVWLRYLALLRGGLGDLADVDTDAVRPVALVGGSYRELCESLQNSHEVIPFAYDWRRSVVRAAKDLADEVEKALNRTRQPVRIVAHSMGGLVARAMIATRPEVWDRICERAGGRLVMLGTPNRGSHDIVEALLGTAATVRQLALLDFEHDAAGITGIIAGFPGVLELLPDAEEFFGEAHWQRYRPTCPASAVPRPGRLTDARKVRKGLPADTPLEHAEHVCYVAGASGRTVTGVELVDGRVVLSATSEGDGRVTYESGRLPGVPMWYMDAVHGDLAAHAPGFAAIRDLLETGTTSRLPTAPPSTARGGEVRFRTLPEPVLYPTESSLAAGVLGQRRARAYRRRAPAGFRVAVLHGDLRHSRFPIVVGHYEGDTIIGAEAQVDGLLGGALSQRYALGVYPGEFGSIAVVLQTPTAVQEALALPSGGIVIGLGKMGDLTASQLGDLIRRAALQYVLQLRDARPRAAAEPLRAGLSILLIGGNSTTNIAVGDSVGAILRGVAQANRELDSRGEAGAAIAEIEIVELYQDTAIEAAHAVKRLAKLVAAELDMDIEAVPLLQRGRDGRPRLAGVASRDAWRRWEISVVKPERKAARPRLPGPLADRLRRAVLETGQPDAELLAALAELALGDLGEEKTELHREIRFLTLSDRARAEATFQQRQPELIERLIKDSISQTRFRAEDSRVLFELTVPNELKSGLAQLDNLVLVVDDETAAYPWELMSAGTKPLCLAKGLVRQLQTSRYRPQIGARAGTAAYVVGDPVVSPPFQQLAGAREEARAVQRMLRARFEVTYRDEQLTALEVLSGLFARPYRIVHLAGHGHYEAPTTPGAKARSGMVLDSGIFLTAVEIQQMQQVPELVFLNCCHIGQTGPAAPRGAGGGVEFNRLAASVSRELIEMGVRAVVAAGWAVNDAAAQGVRGGLLRRNAGRKHVRSRAQARARGNLWPVPGKQHVGRLPGLRRSRLSARSQRSRRVPLVYRACRRGRIRRGGPGHRAQRAAHDGGRCRRVEAARRPCDAAERPGQRLPVGVAGTGRRADGDRLRVRRSGRVRSCLSLPRPRAGGRRRRGHHYAACRGAARQLRGAARRRRGEGPGSAEARAREARGGDRPAGAAHRGGGDRGAVRVAGRGVPAPGDGRGHARGRARDARKGDRKLPLRAPAQCRAQTLRSVSGAELAVVCPAGRQARTGCRHPDRAVRSHRARAIPGDAGLLRRSAHRGRRAPASAQSRRARRRGRGRRFGGAPPRRGVPGGLPVGAAERARDRFGRQADDAPGYIARGPRLYPVRDHREAP